MSRHFTSRATGSASRYGVTFALLLLAASTAKAQTVNYGSLEQVFGEPVTTSATGQPQRATEVPAAMEIVGAQQIRRSGAIDIPGVLKQVPGVDVMQWGTDDADVSVRGCDQAFSPRLLVLIDGRQVYADFYGFTPWNALPVELSAIRQIEVVKGPSTALFGADAVSGVVNIITYNPLYDDVNTASIIGGTQSTGRVSFVTTLQQEGHWGLRLSGSAGTDSDFSTFVPASVSIAGRVQNTRAAADADGVIQLNAGTQVGLEMSHSEVQENDIDPSYELSHDRLLTTSVKGQLDADTHFGLVQAMAYTNWIVQDSLNNLGAPFHFANQSTVIQLQDVLRLGSDNVVRASVEFRHDEVNTTPTAGGYVFYNTPSFSGMWNWTLSPDLSWTNAVRFDSLALGRSGTTPPGYPLQNSDWNRNLTEWSFNSGMVWKPSEEDTVRLLVSRGIELPSLANFGGFVLNTPFFDSSGNPDLKAIAVMNYELDWDRSIAAIGGFLRAALFDQRTTDIIAIEGGFLPGPPPYSLHSNAGDSDAVGGELSLSGNFAQNWHWNASYRFETIKDKFIPAVQNGLADIDFQHVTPKHQLKAGIGWARGNWESDVNLYYQSATDGLIPVQPVTALAPVAAYVSANTRIGYRLNDNFVLSLSGDNLLQPRQIQTAEPAVERQIFVKLTAAY